MEKEKEFYESFRNKRQGRILIRDVVRMEKKVGRIWACVCDCGKSDTYIEDRVRARFPAVLDGEEWEICGRKVFVWRRD